MERKAYIISLNSQLNKIIELATLGSSWKELSKKDTLGQMCEMTSFEVQGVIIGYFWLPLQMPS